MNMTKQNTHFITDFLTKNAWAILVFFVSMVVFYTQVNTRLNTMETQAYEAKVEAASLRTLIERIIVLEEHDKQIVDDIQEIKEDVKEIKKLVR